MYTKERESWKSYFLEIATKAATRATCPRRHVGCIAVRNKRIIATGYNGSPPNEPHCDDIGCELDDTGSCTRTIHAEANVVGQGVDLRGADLYITDTPCDNCAKLLAAVGIVNIYAIREYHSSKKVKLLFKERLQIVE